MFKFLLFACVAFYAILSVRSIPRERSTTLDTESPSPLSHRDDSSWKNETEPSCSCSINATSFGALPHSQNLPEVQNFLPSPSAPAFVWRCNLVAKRITRDDYRCTPGIGSHKLHTRAKVWNEARKICIEEGGHLAIVNSVAEAHVRFDDGFYSPLLTYPTLDESQNPITKFLSS
ncbi:hypothetical protein KPH14_004031 [Odynerus spinipes]|uniref:C-type lectin domain-containing protein n=1 Tax=Odynerus spinipes TaxID=1348599 RepID=A0AAD9VV47_9HYME|nr:hypothetical protein KPH14_004031 [Odynerus spinipes]